MGFLTSILGLVAQCLDNQRNPHRMARPPTMLIMAPKVKRDQTWFIASLGLHDYLSKQGFPPQGFSQSRIHAGREIPLHAQRVGQSPQMHLKEVDLFRSGMTWVYNSQLLSGARKSS